MSVVCGLFCAVQAVVAQASADADASSVELIGLHSWTRQMVKDSLAKHVPGSDTTLTSHACGAEMLQLGFVRTASIMYRGVTIVSVVEPQDSAKALTNPPPTEERKLPDAWQNMLDRFLSADGAFKNQLMQFGIRYYPLILKGKRDSIVNILSSASQPLPAALDAYWEFLNRANDTAAFRQAKDILLHDSVTSHRVFAIGVLANHPKSDEAWHLLLRTLRDENARPGAWLVAQQVLQGWGESFPRRVDWAPARDDIRYLLAGANLWVMPTVMKVLAQTSIQPVLAPQVLAQNGTFPLGYLSSRSPEASSIAQQFLTQISGKSFGADVKQWQTWIGQL